MGSFQMTEMFYVRPQTVHLYNCIFQTCGPYNYRDLWKETRKIRNSKSTTSTCIDNKINDYYITQVFLDKYNILYNSVRYNDNSLNTLLGDNMRVVKQHCIKCSDDDYVFCILGYG